MRDSVDILGYALGDDFDHYTLSLSSKSQRLRNPKLIESRDPKGESAEESLFDEFDTDNGEYPDGAYTLSLDVFQKDNPEKKNDAILLTIDNTPPAVAISEPEPGDTLGCFAAYRFHVDEKNLEIASLFYQKMGDTTVTVIDTLLQEGSGAGPFKTPNEVGNYTMYLRAVDKAGGADTASVEFVVENLQFDVRSGLQQSEGPFTLTIPANGYQAALLCLELRDSTDFDGSFGKITPLPSGIVQIHSSIGDLNSAFTKKSTLTMKLRPQDFARAEKLRFYRGDWHENDWQWNLLGGSVNREDSTFAVGVDRIGLYAAALSDGTPPDDIEAPGGDEPGIVITPRIIRPRGGGLNERADISFFLEKSGTVRLWIFNTSGRLVRKLENGENILSAGSKIISWYGRDDANRFCPTGLYIVRLLTENKAMTGTVMIVN